MMNQTEINAAIEAAALTVLRNRMTIVKGLLALDHPELSAAMLERVAARIIEQSI